MSALSRPDFPSPSRPSPDGLSSGAGAAADIEGFRWALALEGARVFAALLADPARTDKAVLVLKAGAGPVRDAWLEALGDELEGIAINTLPGGITPDRLLGGLDLSATLSRGERVMQSGLLAQADRGVLKVPMADALDPWTAAQVCKALDDGGVRLERDGESAFVPSRFGVILCDESDQAWGGSAHDISGDGGVDPALLERAALHIDLRGISTRAWAFGDDVLEGALGLDEPIDDLEAQADALCCAFGLFSMRVPMQLLAVARAVAQLDGRDEPHSGDLERAMHLSLLSRALTMPPGPQEAEPPEAPEAPDQSEPPEHEDLPEEPQHPPDPPEMDDTPPHENDDTPQEAERPPEEMTIESLLASLPPGLLEQLRSQAGGLKAAQSAGRKGRDGANAKRGRPLGARRGPLSAGKRLDLLATLRASAPWQTLRRSQAAGATRNQTLHLRPSDFHIRRFKQKSGSSTLFAVDASGSTAVNRLAEAKGAVELLLGDSYARRDHVGLIAFRGRAADVLLDPTRSLVRAKRSLATLPGGGGTPLASGLAAARLMALDEARKGRKPTLVLITDGSANVGLDGMGGRARAMEEALACANALRVDGVSCILIDVGRQPTPRAQALAQAMGARYVPMPFASAQALSGVVSSGRAGPRASSGSLVR